MLCFVTIGPLGPDCTVKLVTDDFDAARARAAECGGQVIDRNSLKTPLEAAVLAAQCNAFAKNKLYTWADAGSHVSPRYDVVRIPQVGDDVSYGFNGDYYPCGKIVSVSKDKAYGTGTAYRRIVTKDADGKERIFWRRDNSASWIMDRTWSLVPGIHNDRNPSF